MLARAAADALADAGAKVEDAHPAGRLRRAGGLFVRMVVAAIVAERARTTAEAHGRVAPPGSRSEERVRAAAGVGRVVRALRPAAVPGACRCRPSRTITEGDFVARTIEVNGERVPHRERGRWTGLIGVVGLPSAVVARSVAPRPACRSAMQIVAPYLHDRRAVRVAQLVEEVLGGTPRRPASSVGTEPAAPGGGGP